MATVQSAVRLPTPEPVPAESNGTGRKRNRSPTPRSRSPSRTSSRSPSPRRRRLRDERRSYSRSRSPARRRDGPSAPLPRDYDRARAAERLRQMEIRQREQQDGESKKELTEEEKQAAAKAEYDKLLNMRSGGTYIPPAKLRALQAQITDKSSKEYQRMMWEALKKSINGLINKVNVSNIKNIVPELFQENLIRGRGLYCRSIMKAQAASLPFTPIYASMTAVVNTKLPAVGELLATRLVVQFRKAFKRNDKTTAISSASFLAHLVNQQVVKEELAAQMLLLLLATPTDDSVEIAVSLTREVGLYLEETNSAIAHAIFDQFRHILHEADLEKRTQYQIEVLFQVRKDRYKNHPSIKEELDLVEEEDQITHQISLDDELNVQDGLNVFKYDPEWEANEEAYRKIKAQILGEEDDDDEEYETDEDESSEDEEAPEEKAMEIKDQSNADLVNLRRTIYLTIKSSGGFEECVHKLMRVNIPPGYEEELPSMIVECASQERTFQKFYGQIAERFCKLNRLWMELFEAQFVKYYETIHRYETARLRIIAQLFAWLLASDAIGWHVLSVIHLNEDETTSSSRIFIKILFEDLAQNLGMKKLAERLKEDFLQPSLEGIFPTGDPRHTRFAINFFTAIGMGVLTEGMREYLKNLPKPAPPPIRDASPSGSESVSSYSSYSSYSSSSRSYSKSRSDSRSRSPTPRRRRRDSYSDASRSRSRTRSLTPPRGRSRRDSYTPSPSRSPSVSRSRTPPRRARRASYTPSPSRSPSRGRSVTPPPRRTRRVSYSRSPSRSPTPPPRRGRERRRDDSPSRSRSPSYARSRSPPRRRDSPPPRGAARRISPPPRTRAARRSSPSPARSRGALGARDSRSRSASYTPPPRRPAPAEGRRRAGSSAERSPTPERRRRR